MFSPVFSLVTSLQLTLRHFELVFQRPQLLPQELGHLLVLLSLPAADKPSGSVTLPFHSAHRFTVFIIMIPHVFNKGVMLRHHYKPFLCFSGRVHLEVRWIDQPTQWTVANVADLSNIHLGGHAH